MRFLQVIFFLCLNIAAACAQTAPAAQSGVATAGAQGGQPRLQLTTSIVSQRQTVESNVPFLRWTLRLTYTNTGGQPILLNGHSSAIFKSMVSRSLKAAAAKRYVDETSFSYLDLRKIGVREGEPEEDAFVTLRPGESYSLEKEGFGVRLYEGTQDSEDDLRPGSYFLQLRVATWYYLVRPGSYRERRLDKGYVWSDDITSQPMQFTVEKAVLRK